jgi:DNA polymerase-3 subunit alpha
MPDIDVDVPINKREFIIQYIKEKYGFNKVSQMVTFNTIKGRGALKDVLRVYGNISFEEMNRITKNIPDEAKIADELQEMKEETGEASIIRWALENNEDKLREWCYIDENNELQGPLAKRFEQAIRLEGTKSNQSKHAAGIAISSEPLDELCPMIYDNKNDQLIAGMEMQDLESIGIIKFDILGVAMLDKIMTIQNLLEEGVQI